MGQGIWKCLKSQAAPQESRITCCWAFLPQERAYLCPCSVRVKSITNLDYEHAAEVCEPERERNQFLVFLEGNSCKSTDRSLRSGCLPESWPHEGYRSAERGCLWSTGRVMMTQDLSLQVPGVELSEHRSDFPSVESSFHSQ